MAKTADVKTKQTEKKRTGSFSFVRILKFLFRWSGIIFFALGYILWGAWCFGAICYSPLPWILRAVGAVFFLLLTLSAPLIHPRRWFLTGGLAVMLLVSGLWALIRPTHNRHWAVEVAELPEIQWDASGDVFTVTGIRDFRYRSEKDFDVRYRTKTYRLSDMTGLEYAVVYWDNPLRNGIAHSMMSFRFRNGDALVFSCEARRTFDGKFGAVPDLYKQSGLIYVIGTESDLFGVRTNYREPREQVYLYATNASREQREAIFRDLAGRVNDLRENPKFYNTMTSNCITSLIPSIRAGVEIPLFRPAYLLNGFSDFLAYRLGFLAREYDGETYSALRERSLLNGRTVNWDGDPLTYSKLIHSTGRK